MKPLKIAIALFLPLLPLLPLIGCAESFSPQSTVAVEQSIDNQTKEEAFQQRSLAIREKLAARDLEELDAWWRRINLGDPHKYLLPVILSRLSLPEQYKHEPIWELLLKLEKEQPDIYHFRSVYDVRIFFLFQDIMPNSVKGSYRSMVEMPRILEWMEEGTENHMFMQRLSGLALMDGSGWPNSRPGVAATNEAWLRSELNKFLTIGQGEFHSSTYYGYAIGGLLNLYDFAQTPELRELAKIGLDWYAANMAVRLSWGTAGGAESRGFDRGTWNGSELSAVAWMWWGNDLKPVEKMDDKKARVALFAALSDYRPPQELAALAKKEVPLPFELKASHPGYYSYHADNQFWEIFYITDDYSLGTLLVPHRSYQVQGTINAQYATYKLVIRDRQGANNAVVSLGGTYHSPMADGSSPGDQFLQEKGAVIYQLRLNEEDIAAGVPAVSHLVLPSRYGEPQQYKNWYIWQVEQTWLAARPWGDKIEWRSPVSEKNSDYQVLAANGNQTAWITDVVSTTDYPDLDALKKALDHTAVNDTEWQIQGKLTYKTLAGDRLSLTYVPDSGVGLGRINGEEVRLQNWPVFSSPYLNQDLYSGLLELDYPGGQWRLEMNSPKPKSNQN
ncbi:MULTISPECIES: hypothetical protein [Planktothricoides]|uniref:Uncharacterized protein n=1 Tax=Planktothricoides raciborskii FACHB-1370 TaxID=2949576 RepID=A0ABR8EGS5_9CYAN|nr:MULTISPECIES: hypothetical protein [Planktothricoides]KOR34986.1 hypothetical protein AM228_20925 [Planktothricoides sp. SR001]MBD2544757.1 hypothetical protein [Planktothricoides raciborskii FACHB-1370]MBD2582836.1 hypothetical protein [Planktothricoides raciborskii FACHB-1261]